MCAQIVFAFFRVRLYLLWSRRPDQKDHVAFVSWSVLIVLCCITEYSLIHPTTPLPTCLLFLFLFFVCFCFYFHYSLTYSLSSMVDSFVCFFFIVPRLLASNLAPKKLYRPYFVHVVYRTIVDSESYASFSLSLKALPRSFARVRWRAIHARGHICSFFLHITTHKSRRETEVSIWRRPDVKPFSNIVPIFTISKLNFIFALAS